MNSDLSNVKVGEYIWTIFNGWEEVICVYKDYNGDCPIRLKDSSYTIDGKHFIHNKYPSAFVEPPEEFNPGSKPVPNIPVDTKLLVWNNWSSIKYKRYFSHFEYGKCFCFDEGKTSWNGEKTASWDHYEIVDNK